MFNSRWKLNLIQFDDTTVEYNTELSYKFSHMKKNIELDFTKDQLLKMVKDDEFFSTVYGNILSDRDIIIGKNLINRNFG